MSALVETVATAALLARPSRQGEVRPFRVALALLDVTQEFQRFQASDAQQIGGRLGCDVELLFAGNCARVQERQLRELLSRPVSHRPALIVAQPVGGDRLSGVASAAARQGIGWMLINPRVDYVDVLRQAHPALPIAAVSADQREIGRIQGRQLLARAGSHHGLVLCVTGPSHTAAARDRLAGAREVLSRAGIPIEEVEGDWTESSGFKAASAWIRARRAPWRRWLGGDARMPLALVCHNDHMALGARRAFREHLPAGSALPATFGVDGLPDGGQRLVDLGELSATVIVPANTGPAIHLALRHFRNETTLPAEVLMCPFSYPPLWTLT
jgi:ABC-type sugar transport system substrate-binding protein